MGFKSNENCSPEFLDAGQYQKNGILRYERIFGETFVSTGGEKTTKVTNNKLYYLTSSLKKLNTISECKACIIIVKL